MEGGLPFSADGWTDSELGELYLYVFRCIAVHCHDYGRSVSCRRLVGGKQLAVLKLLRTSTSLSVSRLGCVRLIALATDGVRRPLPVTLDLRLNLLGRPTLLFEEESLTYSSASAYSRRIALNTFLE